MNIDKALDKSEVLMLGLCFVSFTLAVLSKNWSLMLWIFNAASWVFVALKYRRALERWERSRNTTEINMSSSSSSSSEKIEEIEMENIQ